MSLIISLRSQALKKYNSTLVEVVRSHFFMSIKFSFYFLFAINRSYVNLHFLHFKMNIRYFGYAMVKEEQFSLNRILQNQALTL